MRVFDLHCDTAYKMYQLLTDFDSASLHLSYPNIQGYDTYHAVFAFWSDRRLSDEEAFRRFLRMRERFLRIIHQYPSDILKYTMAVEDARMLCCSLERLCTLYTAGIRLLTLTWRGSSCIGGAFDTHNGLTSFGISAVRKCFDIGIIPDISHASEETFLDVYELAKEAKKPFVATHSNSFSVAPHRRNLTDSQFACIRQCNGIVGISMVSEHLNVSKRAKIDNIFSHIEHFLSLDGEDCVCIGSDFDGIELTPTGIQGAQDLYKLADFLSAHNYSDGLINKIFYANAFNFFTANNINI